MLHVLWHKTITQTTREYIAQLISSGHESVLEHATWTILITGFRVPFHTS